MTVSAVRPGSYLKLSDKLFRGPSGQLDVLVPFSQANNSIILMTLCQSMEKGRASERQHRLTVYCYSTALHLPIKHTKRLSWLLPNKNKHPVFPPKRARPPATAPFQYSSVRILFFRRHVILREAKLRTIPIGACWLAVCLSFYWSRDWPDRPEGSACPSLWVPSVTGEPLHCSHRFQQDH